MACVLEALLRQPTIRRRLARAGGLDDLDEVQVARLCFLGFIHDLGKCNWGFQRKILPGVTERAGHVFEVGALLLDARLSAAFEAILPVADMAGWMQDGDPLPLFAAIISHHRRQLRVTDGNMAIPCDSSLPRLWEPAHGHRPLNDVRSVIAAGRSTFARSFETGGTRIPSAAAFQHSFCGLLMLADWIGSDERGFPFQEPNDPPREASARVWAADALARIGLAVEHGRAVVRNAAVGDAAANGFPLNTVQRAVADLPLDPTPGLVVLEAETGSGKTEAALLHFKRLFEAGLVDGLYFALPTRSSASQIQDRVVAWTKRLFPAADRPRVVLALPGYVQADDRRGDVLPRFEVLWEDDPDEVERQRRWAAEHPKRYMAGQIVVGTIDQALLGGLQVPYAHLRSSALLRHLLVVDEVHASDAYMTAVLHALLDAHLTAGGFVLLMSATLGTVARETLQGLDSNQRASLANALRVSYPALTCNRDVPVAIPAAGSVKRVTIECWPHLDQTQEVVSEAVRAANGGAKVLIVRNTVADAVALFEALRDRFATAGRVDLLLTVEGVPTLHHGRFALEDRLLLDQAVEAGLGRGAARPRGLVVVGTQTLEQSLDIDADLLVTDLCPMDVLLQRIGRLHRHPGSPRPNGFVDPRCLLLVPAERDLTPFIDGKQHGLGSVYADLMIVQATRDLLEDHAAIEIPTMSRALVERATHPAALERIVRDGGSAWQRHAATVLGEDYSSRGIAALHVIDRSRPFGSFTFASIDQRVTTRLGADDRLLALTAPGETPPGGAFGQSVTTLKIPGRLTKGVPGDAAVRDLIASPAGFAFTLGDRSFRYDAMGLRPGSD